jgi:endonuclease YncB( thermonuclease family)
VAVLAAVLLVSGCDADKSPKSVVAARGASPVVERPAAPRSVPVVPSAKPVRRSDPAAAGLLFAAPGGDGDSWHDTKGVEYRLGLVNTPETNECYGGKATRKRKALVSAGFRARVYTQDTYGRAVAVITLRDGTNLNVWLARNGYANDKYLAEFRHENPSLAAQLDVAFAAAKREKAGLWSACAARPKPQPLVQQPVSGGSSCHPDYVTCIPIKGDGSGNGDANDLDCGDIGKKVTLRQVGVDPYRLDADGDGFGCDSY